MDAKRPAPRHVIIKMPKVKNKDNPKSSKRKAVTYRGVLIRLSANLPKETAG